MVSRAAEDLLHRCTDPFSAPIYASPSVLQAEHVTPSILTGAAVTDASALDAPQSRKVTEDFVAARSVPLILRSRGQS